MIKMMLVLCFSVRLISDKLFNCQNFSSSKEKFFSSNLFTIFSDDDLEPYPMDDEDDENLASGVRPPVYLSECISGN